VLAVASSAPSVKIAGQKPRTVASYRIICSKRLSLALEALADVNGRRFPKVGDNATLESLFAQVSGPASRLHNTALPSRTKFGRLVSFSIAASRSSRNHRSPFPATLMGAGCPDSTTEGLNAFFVEIARRGLCSHKARPGAREIVG
jgi:hypothetical protein